MTSRIDAAAASLRRDSRAFTRKNLFFAAARLGGARDYDAFVAGPLARRLRAGPIAGLLPAPDPRRTVRLPRECDAYFPAAILLVDRPELVELFAASGVLVQARIAVVCVDGTPRAVVRWLVRGIRAGYRAPVGYLHDAATVLYPFACEPLATLVEVAHARTPIVFRDLGLPPSGLPASALPFHRATGPVVELEAPPPAAIVAYAARQLAAMLPRDPWLAPIRRSRRSG
ncbi:MAG TPA: hypothetical protein VLX92_32240 [Kofleriaceae bacterium]|nr:hypothetical protein [Kofleriaceae bacterium]